QESPGGTKVYRWSTSGGPVDFNIGDLADLFDFGGERGGGPGPIFEQFFRKSGDAARFRTQAPPPPLPNADHEQAVELDFEQAAHGTTLSLTVAIPGSRGDYRIDVKIPPFVSEGLRVRVRGKGRPNQRGGRGDLYIRCRIRPHRFFRRDGNDVYVDLPITITEAALGAKVSVPTVDGMTTVTIPPGTASGKKLRLARRGVPDSRGGSRGDQYAVIKIVPPARLNAKQRKSLEAFAAADGTNPREKLW
ncbi:MAG: J domain-containing protein, partial [Phycisphaerae bacterium]